MNSYSGYWEWDSIGRYATESRKGTYSHPVGTFAGSIFHQELGAKTFRWIGIVVPSNQWWDRMHH
jgi:hypothetical protein